MPLSWNLCIQVLITLSACIGAIGDLWPAKWVPYIATIQAIIQIILTNHAGKRNPDGKSATLAFNPATGKSVDFAYGDTAMKQEGGQ